LVLAQLVIHRLQHLLTAAIQFLQPSHRLVAVAAVYLQLVALKLAMADQAAVHLLILLENKVQEIHHRLAHHKEITVVTALI
jgi:hypothetical protein